jgi:hypothetical protein
MSTEKLNKLYFGMLKKHVKAHRQSSGGARVPASMRAGIKAKAMRGARSKHARMKMSSDITNIDTLAKLFKLPDAEKIMDLDMGSETYSYVHNEALKEGASEEQAEERAQKAEEEEQDERYKKWYDAIEAISDDLFGKHGLTLVPRKYKKKGVKRPFDFKIVPKTSWADAANKIRETINGVGVFGFDSLKDFLDSGPYTAREAVLGHIGWINDYPEVYGDYSPSHQYDRHMRY